MLEHPNRLIVIAVVLLISGFVVPFLMVIKMVESTFFLNFVSFGAQVIGLFLGIIGVTMYRVKSKKKKEENSYE